MDQNIRKHLDDLHSGDPNVRYGAYQYVIDLTERPVDWAYEVWGEFLEMLKMGNNHQRSIAAQVLSSLSISDPDNRMLSDFDRLIEGTYDERFVTARHTLESLWKVGVAKPAFLPMVLEKLVHRFDVAGTEKNGTLLRYDIIKVLRRMYDRVNDGVVMQQALELVETEQDLKYRKKYAGLWKDLTKGRKKP